MVKRNLMLPDVLFDEFGDDGGLAALSFLSAHSVNSSTQNGYVCGFVVDNVVGTDISIEDDEPGDAKYIAIHTPGLYYSQISFGPNGSPNTRSIFFHPDPINAPAANHVSGIYQAHDDGLSTDSIGVSAMVYWTAPGEYIFDVQSDDPDTLFNEAYVTIFRVR